MTTIVSTAVILRESRKIVYSETFPSPDGLNKNAEGRGPCCHQGVWSACKRMRSAECEWFPAGPRELP